MSRKQTVQIKDQVAHLVPPDLDLHCSERQLLGNGALRIKIKRKKYTKTQQKGKPTNQFQQTLASDLK